jgi:hypothetical protein
MILWAFSISLNICCLTLFIQCFVIGGLKSIYLKTKRALTISFLVLHHSWDCLKVPKRENFSLTFFALSEPIWVCDWETGEKVDFFYQLTPDFEGFGYLPHTECAVNENKIWSYAKIKCWRWLILSPYVCLQCVFEEFWFFYESLTILRTVNFF